MSDQPDSLVYGVLTPDTWTDFVTRLRYDCNGPRCRDHSTAAAIFTVENERLIYGIDLDYDPERVVLCDGDEWFSPQEYWNDLHDDESKANLNRLMQDCCSKQFMKASEECQWDVLGELPDHTVTGYSKEWEHVNSHFTHAAAEAFIARKKHDYRKMRVYVESQYYCWEFEAIKAAILSGELVYQPKELT